MSTYTYKQLAKECRREINYRTWVYPQSVRKGKMTTPQMASRIAMMEEMEKHFLALSTKREELPL